MAVFQTGCLYSTVKNVSGGTKKFSFLPPHGAELDDDEEYTVFGDIRDAINPHNFVTSQRYRDALENSLKNQELEIVSTPNPVLYDETLDFTKMLELDNGSLAAVAPCWSESVSGT